MGGGAALEQTALDLEPESGDSCVYVWFGHIEVDVECVGSYKPIKDVPPKYNVDAPRWEWHSEIFIKW